MHNPFINKIGIWYNNTSDRNFLLDTFKEWFKEDKFYINSYEAYISFKNGDIICFIKINDSGRGSCFTESFIYDPRDKVSLEVINCIIKPCTKIGSKKVYKLSGKDNETLYREIAFNRSEI